MDEKKLSEMQKDVLREIGNIGAGNATTSMSQMINKEVSMEVPNVQVLSINEMMEVIGGPEKLVVSIFFRIKGEVEGTVYFVLTLEEAEQLVRQMLMDEEYQLVQDNRIDDMALSVLQELSNILTGSYLSALADFTNLAMSPSIPHISIDMAAAAIVSGLIEVSQETDSVIMIDTKIISEKVGNGVDGHFLLIPNPTSIPTLFSALGISDGE